MTQKFPNIFYNRTKLTKSLSKCKINEDIPGVSLLPPSLPHLSGIHVPQMAENIPMAKVERIAGRHVLSVGLHHVALGGAGDHPAAGDPLSFFDHQRDGVGHRIRRR